MADSAYIEEGFLDCMCRAFVADFATNAKRKRAHFARNDALGGEAAAYYAPKTKPRATPLRITTLGRGEINGLRWWLGRIWCGRRRRWR